MGNLHVVRDVFYKCLNGCHNLFLHQVLYGKCKLSKMAVYPTCAAESVPETHREPQPLLHCLSLHHLHTEHHSVLLTTTHTPVCKA